MKKLLIVMTVLMLVMGFAFTASAGSYYLYADFTTGNSSFLGGYDVDSYGNYIYVNRGNQIDRYTLTTLDSDSDGKVEPDQHPSNIGPDGISGTADDKVGPMETRTLTHDTTYSVSEIGSQSVSEIYATANGLYFLDDYSDVSYYDFSTSNVTQVTAVSSTNLSQLGRASDGTWWASSENNNVYSYNDSTNTWDYKFTHTNFSGGGHLDGLELAFLDTTDDGVDNPVEYIFISDMYADNIGRDNSSGTQLESYSYPGSGSSIVVEGMGFGANNHFWMTGSDHLYEVGGGAFAGIKPDDTVPEPATMLLLGSGLLGLAGLSRKKKISKKS